MDYPAGYGRSGRRVLRHEPGQLQTNAGEDQPRLADVPARRILSRRRVQVASSVLLASLLPWLIRSLFLPGRPFESAATNTFIANCVAVLIAFWVRLSIESYPGIRRAYVILPSALTGHGCVLLWFALTRLPYDRIALVLGFLVHVTWLYAIFVSAELGARRRIAVVPFGRIDPLEKIVGVHWLALARPRLHDTRGCEAIVADFGADLPQEWQGFLAEAAIAGRIVYQVKQLSESLTGRVELEHLSENSFGSLVPARGYFYLKSLADFLFALLVLPVALPVLAAVALAIRAVDRGPALFRQTRIGHSGKHIIVYKFRTMHDVPTEDERIAAMTGNDDARITRLGRVLRKTRVDELPQIFNNHKGEMSWNGPRPESDTLSRWYEGEIPFYRYRHVVKPGISGWAQVNQGHVAEVEQVHRKLQYDFYYIKYFSPWLDLLIVVRTIKTIFSRFGAK
jgi:lipopolysaccharide/colanic/teichoic acid biosynthesis glycosyltransferase